MRRGIARAYQSYSRGVDRFTEVLGSNVYLGAGFVSLVLLSWGLAMGWPAYLEFWAGHGWNGLVYVKTKYSSYVTTAGSYALFPSLLILIGLLILPVVIASEKGWWWFSPKKARSRKKKAKPRRPGKLRSVVQKHWDRICMTMERVCHLMEWMGRFNWEKIISRTFYLLLIGVALFPAWRAAPVLLSQWDWNQTVNISWSDPRILVPIWFAFLLSFWAILLCAFNIPSSKTNPIRRVLKGLMTRLFDRQSRHPVKEEQDAS
jgi:hypothetical protein